MTSYASDIAFTPTVKAIQEEKGSRRAYHSMEDRGGWPTTVTVDLRQFLSELDMFYLGTANASGQPYIQYRGGSKGFLRALSDKTLGFADFGGNRQYITLGNLRDNPQAFLFLMDYENQRRIKVWGQARVVEDDSMLLSQLADSRYPAQVERAILFDIEAWSANCQQHIHRRIPAAKVEAEIALLERRIAELRTQTKS